MRFATFKLLPLLLSLPLVSLAGPVEVTASRLNVRTGPGGQVIGQAVQGSRFVARGSGGASADWEAIDFAGRRAYVAARYLRPAQGSALRISATSLHVRSGPSTDHASLGFVSQGQEYVRLGGQEGWSKIQFDHRQGWVSDRYLEQLGAADRLLGRDRADGSGDATTTPGGASSDSGGATPGGAGSGDSTSSSGGANPGPGSASSGGSASVPSAPAPNGSAAPDGSAGPAGSAQPPTSAPTGNGLRSAYRGLSYMGAQVPRAGLYNSILRKAEPYGSQSSYSGLLFVRGKVSWFGGASDTGVTRTETGTITGERLRSLNVPARPNSSDLRTRPEDFYYVAMRWDYRPQGRTFWRRARLVVISPSTGRMVVVRPVDWGPHTRTRRILDLSPQALRDLGIQTDAEALVAFVDPSTPLGVLR